MQVMHEQASQVNAISEEKIFIITRSGGPFTNINPSMDK